jgi:NTE family protein
MSIGAINAAIIVGNAPNDRVDRLREFWMQVTSDGPWPGAGNACLDFTRGDAMRQLINQMSAGFAMASGARGFFKARPVPLWFQPTGTIDATSVYDTSELKRTLERLVDFDRINAGATRLSVGAVNIRSGNFAYFDNATLRSGLSTLWRVARCRRAFPPSKSKASITGIAGWSRTPLQWVVETEPRRDTLAFQVDLRSARGEFPRNIFDVMTREKEIRYSSRTRASTNQFKHIQKLRHTLAGLLEKLPEELKNGPEARMLGTVAERKLYNIVHLIYRAKSYEGHSKDYEFSRLSMQEHWRAGYHDARRTLRHLEVLERPTNHEGVFTFDLAQDGRE